jgi:hypothetical protein
MIAEFCKVLLTLYYINHLSCQRQLTTKWKLGFTRKIKSKPFIKPWFHVRFFSAKCEIFRLFLLNCDYSNKLFLLDCSQFKRNRRNISHFAEKKRSWNQAFKMCVQRSSKIQWIWIQELDYNYFSASTRGLLEQDFAFCCFYGINLGKKYYGTAAGHLHFYQELDSRTIHFFIW